MISFRTELETDLDINFQHYPFTLKVSLLFSEVPESLILNPKLVTSHSKALTPSDFKLLS